MRGRVRISTIAVAFGGTVCMLFAVTARAASWNWEVDLARGVPGGFIQVRENSVDGTRLPFGPALGFDSFPRLRLEAVDNKEPGGVLVLRLDFARISGETVFSKPVYFNGVELAAGQPVTSIANWDNYWQFTMLYRHRLLGGRRGASLAGEIGFTYVGLTYSLQGHPVGAANSAELSGSTTVEDFITQELPVPQVGLEFNYPLTGSWTVQASVLGGHLPRVYSLRNEGGKVYVTQTNQVFRWGLDYHWNSNLRTGIGWYDRYYMQYEQSAEDGNYIRMPEHGLYMDLRYRF
jgi:hypothetical protein